MDEKNRINTFRNLFAQNRINEAITELNYITNHFPSVQEVLNIKDSLLIQSSRISSINDRLTKGIVKLEDADRLENQIKESILTLSRKIELLQKEISIDKNINNLHRKLIGTWYSDYIDYLYKNGTAIRELWTLPENEKESLEYYYFEKDTMDYIGDIESNNWYLKNSILVEFNEANIIGESIIEWIDKDMFKLSIITAQDSELLNLTKFYKRLKI